MGNGYKRDKFTVFVGRKGVGKESKGGQVVTVVDSGKRVRRRDNNASGTSLMDSFMEEKHDNSNHVVKWPS